MEATKKPVVAGIVFTFFSATVPAGFPSPAQDYQEEEINLSDVLQPNPATTFIIRIQGDSMMDANMPNGSLAVVDKSIQPASGHIVVAVLNGEFTVKRLVLTNRHVVLHPESAFYKPIVVTEAMDFQVWGVVTHTIVDQMKKV